MRYFMSFVIGISFIVLVFVLILRGFGGSDDQKSTQKPMVNYATTSTVVQMTVDGPLTANQTHYQSRFTVDQSQTQVHIIQGYEGNVVRNQTYASNTNAYASFLRALDLAGYSKGDANPDLADERGHCPRGSRYIFKISDGSRDIQRYWTTSCGQGNFKGNTMLVKSLFLAQAPDYEKLFVGLNTNLLK